MSVTDVLIIGAGPAGLACAATVLDHSRLSVVILDAGHGPGGQYWRQPPPATGKGALDASELADLHHDRATFDELVRRLQRGREEGRAETRSGQHVWSVVPEQDGYAAHLVDRGRTDGRVAGS